MKQISFTIPGEPKAQQRHRDCKGTKRKYDPSAGEKTAFAWQAKAQCNPDEPLTEDLHMILLCYGAYVRGDIDNYLKFVMDALQGIYFVNDKQLKWVEVMLFKDSKNPRTDVHISPLEAGPASPG